MRWSLASVMVCCVGLLGCTDDGPPAAEVGEESGATESGDGDGDSGDGDGDGDAGDGDGDSGDGDGDSGDGDSGDGDGDGDGDSGDGDGDLCNSDGFLGAGIAEDGWGIDDLCDEVYVCVPGPQYDAFIAEFDDVECQSDLSCGDGQRCILAEGTVDQDVMADACTALTIVDTVWCAVWGP